MKLRNNPSKAQRQGILRWSPFSCALLARPAPFLPRIASQAKLRRAFTKIMDDTVSIVLVK
jgi:hypothetical protein